jgi:small-conductance mechanosensitive channel
MSIGANLIGLTDLINSYLPSGTPDYVGEVIVSIGILIIFIIAGWIVYHIFEKFLIQWAKKTKTRLDDEILANIKAPVYAFVILLGAFYGLESISALQPYDNILDGIFKVAQIALVALIVIRIINVLIAWYGERSKKRGKSMSDHLLFIMKKILQIVVVIFAFLAILAAFNVDLTGAMVGLGVTGIVIGFALQNILGDFFSAFTIYFDKPYEVGDFIIIGEDMGVVKKIGIKSTRLQTLHGEELVVSNNDMINSRIHNYKKMKKRRIVFTIGVTYETPLTKLKKIPDIITGIINTKNIDHVDTLDRVHFKQFGDFSLNFEVVYYIKTGDYNKYMDTQQEINFKIKEAFEKEGIEMAFPTQTIFLNK